MRFFICVVLPFEKMSIKVSHISKNYGSQKALQDVTFTLKKGEVVGFLGPNGAGKSTLMKILTTYLNADEGTAHVQGFSISDEPRNVQRSIGYLPEHNPLYLDMYVKEYLLFNANIYGLDQSAVASAIEKTVLQPEAHKKIQQLSKGYRQRVGLANALLHEPEVLILDEPTTGLDPNQLVEIRQLIKTLGKEKTILLSTHILQEVQAICDRVIIIHQGKIVMDETLDALTNSQKQIIEVTFDYRVEEEALRQIKGIIKIDNIEGFTYHLQFGSKDDKRAAVFDFAHDHGLKILELQHKGTSLEAIFTKLTTQK